MNESGGSARKRWRERARRIEQAARQLVAGAITVDDVGCESTCSTQALRRLERLLALVDAEKIAPTLTLGQRKSLLWFSTEPELYRQEDITEAHAMERMGLVVVSVVTSDAGQSRFRNQVVHATAAGRAVAGLIRKAGM